MSSRTFLLSAHALVLLSCGSEEPLSASLVQPGSASCEALADHLIAECPDARGRLFEILMCEEDRRQEEPLGCGHDWAALVTCRSESPIDCESGEQPACEDELVQAIRCRQSFTLGTGCSRIEAQDFRCAGSSATPYAFGCLGSTPRGCVPSPDDPLTLCCPSFAKESESYFRDPELGPDELPPDYSGVAFDDPAACLDFADEQGWGRCEESSACACESCANELASCASEHSCLFIRNCDLGTGTCNPSEDEFFMGYGGGAGKADAVTACMEAAGCSAPCTSP